MNVEWLGWASSLILLITVGKQIQKQWRAGTSEGVSKWLFVGQMAASSGFMLYSFLIHNWVFAATNALMTLSAIVGLLIVMRHRAEKARD